MCVCVVCLLRTVTVQPAISTSLPHTQGLLSGSMRSASYSIRRGSDLESSGGSKPAPSALGKEYICTANKTLGSLFIKSY